MNDNHDIRLARISRVSHPRATIWAAILLVVVFLGFGVWAEAHVEDVPGADTAITTAFLEAGIALLE